MAFSRNSQYSRSSKWLLSVWSFMVVSGFGVNISLCSRFFNRGSGFTSFFPQQEKQGLSVASSGLRMPRAWAIMHMRAMTG